MRNSGAAIRQYGASLLELSVVVVVISILAATLSQRLIHAQEYAEKVTMELMVSNFRSALRAKVGELLIADKVDEMSTLIGANPVDWMDRLPENYRGVLNDTPGTDFSGQWYFDAGKRELVYTVNSQRYFVPRASGDYTVRYRISPVTTANTGAVGEQQVWVHLELVENYTWF